MDAASDAMRARLAAHPELGNPAAVLIANAYTNLGAISRAFPLYERAIAEMRGQALPPLAYAAALERGAYAAQRDGHLDQSKAWIRELKPLLQPESEQVARIRDGMIGTEWLIDRDGGKAELALATAESGLAALAPWREALPDLVQRATGRRGTSLTDVGRFEEAEVELRRAHATAVALFGEQHGRSLVARQTLGWHYTCAGKPALGLAELEPIAERIRTVFGANSQAYGANLHNRGNAYYALGRTDEAIAAFRASAASYRGSTSDQSAQVGWALINVGNILLERGKAGDALDAFREVEISWRSSMAEDAPVRADLAQAMAGAEHQLQLDAVAARHVAQAIALRRRDPRQAGQLAAALALAAEIARGVGRVDGAMALYDEAIATGVDAGTEPALLEQWRSWRATLR